MLTGLLTVYFLINKIVINNFGIADKLLGQTYDVASMLSVHVNCLQTKVYASYPKAIFFKLWVVFLPFPLNSLKEYTPCKNLWRRYYPQLHQPDGIFYI